MPTTENGYYYPDASTNLTPLAAILAAMAASSDAAYKKIPAVFDTIAARDAAITTPTEGRIVYTKDYDILWSYDGSSWVPVGVPSFANITARNAAIPAPLVGMACTLIDTKEEYRCIDPGVWALWSRPDSVWTPSISGVTAGLSVASAYYEVAAGLVTYYLKLNCTGALSGSALRIANLPIAQSGVTWAPLGQAMLNPAGIRYQGVVRRGGATEVMIIAPGANGVDAEVTASVPATWSARSPAIIAKWSVVAVLPTL